MNKQIKIGDFVSIEGYFEVVALEKKFDGKVYAKVVRNEKDNDYIVVLADACVPVSEPSEYVAPDGSM